jgi:hypothetical protein
MGRTGTVVEGAGTVGRIEMGRQNAPSTLRSAAAAGSVSNALSRQQQTYRTTRSIGLNIRDSPQEDPLAPSPVSTYYVIRAKRLPGETEALYHHRDTETQRRTELYFE